MKEYTEEFYKLNINVRNIKEDVEKVSMYLNGLISEIQYEIGIMTLNISHTHGDCWDNLLNH